jgi:hypothetical protein
VKVHLCCFVGLWLRSTFSLWTTIDGSIPDISSWLQVNTSLFRCRNATNFSFYFFGELRPLSHFLLRISNLKFLKVFDWLFQLCSIFSIFLSFLPETGLLEKTFQASILATSGRCLVTFHHSDSFIDRGLHA